MLRTHTCGELRKEHVGKKITLCGWARFIRDHKNFAFVILADRYGTTQIYLDEKQKEGLEREAFISITGEVKERPAEDINPEMVTGEIEVTCKELKILSHCDTLPFDIHDDTDAREETRLKYRFLDMRRPKMVHRLTMRSRIAAAIRNALEEQSFLEVETPMFVRSTPEGSRDFVVPSRIHEGQFYALPQSPQLYKQMLMIAGIDRYYQFARCFRDEDARRERQLVHTQVDIEMSLVAPEDVYRAVEYAMSKAFSDALDIEIDISFPVYTYDEVIRRWGIDKPDLRFGMELIDFNEAVKSSELQIFTKILESGGIVKGIVAEQCASYSRSKISELEKFAKTFGARGLMWFKVKEGKLQGSLVKKMSAESVADIHKTSAAQDDDLILIIAGDTQSVSRSLGELRNRLARDLDLIPQGVYKFLWVSDFPLFEWDEETKRWTPMHHMFSMPKEEFVDNFEQDPGAVRAQLYDLVLNGVELGSGSVRISSPEIQKRVMNLIGMSEEEADKKFGFLLNAYRYASPPHGGIGIGFDNLVMTMLGETNIREVIAYPNASNGSFLYDSSPGTIEPEQVEELHIKIVEKEKEEEKEDKDEKEKS